MRLLKRLDKCVAGVVGVEPRIIEPEPILLVEGHALLVARVVHDVPPDAEVERRFLEDQVVGIAARLVVKAWMPTIDGL